MKVIDGKKRCTRCKELKGVELFNLSNKKWGYRSSICKKCFNVYQKEYYKKHREECLKRGKKYYHENKEFILRKLKLKRIAEREG